MARQIFRGRGVVGQGVPQRVLGIVLGGPHVGAPLAVPPAIAGQVEHRMDEEGTRPRLEAVRLAQRVQLLVRDQLHEGGLDGVLEVVLQLGVAPAAERHPVLAEVLEHGSEPRIGRLRMRRAQDAEDGFRRPSQHVIPPDSH